MKNIEKLLMRLASMKGRRLDIIQGQPVRITRASGETLPLIKRSLESKEWNYLEEEISLLFGNDSVIDFKGLHLRTERNDEELRRTFYSQEKAPVPKKKESFQLNEALKLMLQHKASDLHLSSGCVPRIRVDGEIEEMQEYESLDPELIENEVMAVAPEVNREEYRKDRDTDFALAVENLGRFRVNLFMDHRGIGAVLRYIPQEILTISKLGIPDAIVKLCDKPKGLILVTGPTGSGKSTTLAALIDHINRHMARHIITIEDPLEFIHDNKRSLVNQREINTHTRTFKAALRAALREDPDVVLVGEMRDLETISIAVETAVTGHLVFGTLHTSTAIGTVDRIIDQFPPDQQEQIRVMLADSLVGVISQTLPRRKNGGRVGAFEVLIITNAVANLIRESKTHQIATLMQTGKGIGMQTLNSHLARLVADGTVEEAEAMRKAVDTKELFNLLERTGREAAGSPGSQ